MPVDFSRFNLTPDVTPLIKTLQPLIASKTPAGRAATAQAEAQTDYLRAQAENEQVEAQKTQAIMGGVQALQTLDSDSDDIGFVLNGVGEDGANLYNNIRNYLATNQDRLSPQDLQDAADLASRAQHDPLGAMKELQDRRGNLDKLRKRTLLSLAMLGEDVSSMSNNVQSTNFLPGGYVQVATKDGQTYLMGPGGETIEGEEAVQAALADSNRYATEKAGRENALRVAVNYVDDVYAKVGGIEESITNMRQGIRLIEEGGANTGWFADRMPAFDSATILLRQMQRQLGLGVIQSVTFGALSEKEMKLAMETGDPKGLDEAAKVQYYKDKIRAQEKVLTAINEATMYLGGGNKTLQDWVEYKSQQNNENRRGKNDDGTYQQRESIP